MEAGLEHALWMQILIGAGLAAASGLRAFLPALVVGSLARLEWVTLRGELDWLASTPALVIFGTAVVLEVLGDKVPLLDHALDLAGTVVKPLAGALMAAVPLVDMGPLATLLLALALGGGVAGAVHVTKSGLRLASTGSTGGMGNPALSLAEDGLSLTGSLLAVLAPLLLLVLLVLAVLLLNFIARRLQASHARRQRFS